MAGKSTKGWFARYWPRVFLIIPFLLVVWVPFYNRIEPALSGIPFFYWYQLASILVGAAVVLLVYLLEVRITRTIKAAHADLDSPGGPGDIL